MGGIVFCTLGKEVCGVCVWREKERWTYYCIDAVDDCVEWVRFELLHSFAI